VSRAEVVLNSVYIFRAARQIPSAAAPAVRPEGGVGMTRLEELTERMTRAVGTDSGLGKTLKFNLKGDGFVFIDGGSVTNDDKAADLTLTISMDDLIALGDGKLDPMTAVMNGALQISDMGLAMGLQAKMQALFSKLQS
jgi:putative sterol carrier protein